MSLLIAVGPACVAALAGMGLASRLTKPSLLWWALLVWAIATIGYVLSCGPICWTAIDAAVPLDGENPQRFAIPLDLFLTVFKVTSGGFAAVTAGFVGGALTPSRWFLSAFIAVGFGGATWLAGVFAFAWASTQFCMYYQVL